MPVFLKAFGIGFLLFIIGLVMVQKDLRLRIWGITAEAVITEAWDSSGMSRRSTPNVGLLFRFPDAQGVDVIGEAHVAVDWKRPEDNKVKIIYLPGDPKIHKLAEASSLGSYVLFLLGIVLMGMGVFLFFNQSVVDSHKTASTPSRFGRLGKLMGE